MGWDIGDDNGKWDKWDGNEGWELRMIGNGVHRMECMGWEGNGVHGMGEEWEWGTWDGRGIGLGGFYVGMGDK